MCSNLLSIVLVAVSSFPTLPPDFKGKHAANDDGKEGGKCKRVRGERRGEEKKRRKKEKKKREKKQSHSFHRKCKLEARLRAYKENTAKTRQSHAVCKAA